MTMPIEEETGWYIANLRGAKMARDLAAECLEEASKQTGQQAWKYIADHDRHMERAKFYEMMARRCEAQQQISEAAE